jgi:hypothetical protein
MLTSLKARFALLRRYSDAGVGLAGAVIMAALMSCLGAVTVSGALSGIDAAHHAVGEANVHQIEQAAQIDQLTNGTDAHTALVTASAACACAVEADPIADVLVYRAGDRIVSVDVASGVQTSASAADSDLPVYGPPNPVMTINVGG